LLLISFDRFIKEPEFDEFRIVNLFTGGMATLLWESVQGLLQGERTARNSADSEESALDRPRAIP
jgi:hypothetical protein